MIRWTHQMPFGAAVQHDGSVRFRLWAPAARRVQLCLEASDGERLLEMPTVGDGWHECVTDSAGVGALYRYRIDGGMDVPDPASRFQPGSIHGPSQVIDPGAFAWRDGDWKGRPWEEAVFYELHVGTFSPEGTFDGVIKRLDHLAELGVTAIELMPVATFPGVRNWGYDGALLFAPHASYGHAEDLKRLVEAAHARGLMIFLDVVYNHFGPEGNYLHLYAPQFFTERHHTPWGAGINFDGEDRAVVRDFFIQNALYWLTEYRFDGLRLDAVHAIADDCDPDILSALAEAVQAGPGRERRVHLVLENDHNAAHYLARSTNGEPRWYVAQWNDDFHHAAHRLVSGEADGYYIDYADDPVSHLGRCLAEGFAYQGEASAFRDGRPRGEPSADLPPTAFVNLMQNHDQAGNRAFGERIAELAAAEAIRAGLAVLLLAPSPPLLFMGQEWMSRRPFLFFCDFSDDLAASVTEGRRREFAGFAQFSDAQARASIPDPNDPETFERCQLDWQRLDEADAQAWLQLHRELIALRRREIVPRLAGVRGGVGRFELLPSPGDEPGLRVQWRLGDGTRLVLTANLNGREIELPEAARAPAGKPLYLLPESAGAALSAGRLLPWSVAWHLDTAAQGRER